MKKIVKKILFIFFAFIIVNSVNYATDENINTSYDLREYIELGVKDQESSNSCWAFASTTVLETLLQLKYGETWDFSEMHMEYATSRSFTDAQLGLIPFNREVNGGGNSQIAMAYYTSGNGPVLETDMPFSEEFDEISIDEVKNKTVQKQIEEWVSIKGLFLEKQETQMHYWYYDENNNYTYTAYSTNEGEEVLGKRINSIKEHIMENGAVSISICAEKWEEYINKETCSYYCSQAYNYETEEWTYSDHEVMIIGWDDNYSKENFTSENQPLEDGAWIVLNTWGEGTEEMGVTEEGIFYLSYYDAITNMYNAYGIVKATDVDYDNLYQYDPLSFSDAIKIDDSYIYGANVFTRAEQDLEYLTEVSIASCCDMEYEIYVNAIDGTFETDKFEKVAESSDVETSEYFTVQLDTPVSLEGEQFVVAVKYIKSDNENLSLAVEIPSTDTNSDFIDRYQYATSNAGESYMGTSLDNMQDLYTTGYENANICIKAFTIDTEPQPVENVSLPTVLYLEIGETITLTPEITPENATNKNVTWESTDSNVAIVNENGEVTAKQLGVSTIVVTTKSGNKVATCSIIVAEKQTGQVTGIELNKTETTIEVGLDETLVATVYPTYAENKTVNWSSSDTTVAIVNSEGRITTLSTGEVTITATTEDGEFVAECKVIVTDKVVPVEYVILDVNEMSLVIGQYKKLTATVYPENATNQEIVWLSSDSDIAKVADDGTVTGVSEGTVIITAATKSGSKIAECRVTVDKILIPIYNLTLNTESLQVEKNRYDKIEATVNPDNATYANIMWTTSNPDIVQVDSYGVIKGIEIGKAIITATTEDGSKSAECEVEVIPVQLKGISLKNSEIELKEGETSNIEVILTPEDAPKPNLIFSSTKTSVATVDENGKITAIKQGTTKITVTTEDGEHTTTCNVTVVPKVIKVTDITLNKSTIQMYVGNVETLQATILPENAENKKIIWSSSDEKVATINENGEITAQALGTTRIEVVTEDGAYTAHCTVNVVEVPIKIEVNKDSENTYIINEDEEIICNIQPETTVKEFRETITTNSEKFEIYDVQGNLMKDSDIIGTSMILKLDRELSYTLIVVGDLNGDGKVTAVDLSKMKLRLTGLTTLSEYFERAADINNNGSLTALDLSLLKQILVGM